MGARDLFPEALKRDMIAMGRQHLKESLAPPFGTAEQRARVNEIVDAKTDDEILTVFEHIAEEDAKRCPECGRPYEIES